MLQYCMINAYNGLWVSSGWDNVVCQNLSWAHSGTFSFVSSSCSLRRAPETPPNFSAGGPEGSQVTKEAAGWGWGFSTVRIKVVRGPSHCQMMIQRGINFQPGVHQRHPLHRGETGHHWQRPFKDTDGAAWNPPRGKHSRSHHQTLTVLFFSSH